MYKQISDAEEKQLVAMVLNGDKQAYGVIIKHTEGLVAMIVYRMIPNREDRRDIAQDVFLKAYHRLESFRFKSRLSTWIAQIAYNTCLHFLEKKRVMLIGDLYEENTGDADNHPALSVRSENETEARLSEKELSLVLQTEIDSLPPLYKTLISLFHQEELSYGEIAKVTGLPEGTLKSYLFRARKMLKDKLLTKYKREDL